MIYDPSARHNTETIICDTDVDLVVEVDLSKSTSETIIYILGTLVAWKSKASLIVVQSTMEVEMIAMVYRKVQIDWLKDVI